MLETDDFLFHAEEVPAFPESVRKSVAATFLQNAAELLAKSGIQLSNPLQFDAAAISSQQNAIFFGGDAIYAVRSGRSLFTRKQINDQQEANASETKVLFPSVSSTITACKTLVFAQTVDPRHLNHEEIERLQQYSQTVADTITMQYKALRKTITIFPEFEQLLDQVVPNESAFSAFVFSKNEEFLQNTNLGISKPESPFRTTLIMILEEIFVLAAIVAKVSYRHFDPDSMLSLHLRSVSHSDQTESQYLSFINSSVFMKAKLFDQEGKETREQRAETVFHPRDISERELTLDYHRPTAQVLRLTKQVLEISHALKHGHELAYLFEQLQYSKENSHLPIDVIVLTSIHVRGEEVRQRLVLPHRGIPNKAESESDEMEYPTWRPRLYIKNLPIFLRTMDRLLSALETSKSHWANGQTAESVWKNATHSDLLHPIHYLERIIYQVSQPDILPLQAVCTDPIVISPDSQLFLHISQQHSSKAYESGADLQFGFTTSPTDRPTRGQFLPRFRYGITKPGEATLYALQMENVGVNQAEVLQSLEKGNEQINQAFHELIRMHEKDRSTYNILFGDSDIPEEILDLLLTHPPVLVFLEWLKHVAATNQNYIRIAKSERLFSHDRDFYQQVFDITTRYKFYEGLSEEKRKEWSGVFWQLRAAAQNTYWQDELSHYKELFDDRTASVRQWNQTLRFRGDKNGPFASEFKTTSPALFLTAVCGIAALWTNGIRRIRIPVSAPLRPHDATTDERIFSQLQTVILRAAEEVRGIEIVSDVDDQHEFGYIHITLTELSSDNPVLQQCIDAILEPKTP